MSRQTLGVKKTEALRKQTGLPILRVMVRGGTNHRRDLIMEDGSLVYLWKDGTLEDSGVKLKLV